MHEQEHTGQALIEEIRRYLAAVDLFRSLGCEPTWRAELPPAIAVQTASTSARRYARR